MRERDDRVWREAYNATLAGLVAHDPDHVGLSYNTAREIARHTADDALEEYHERFGSQSEEAEPAWQGHAKLSQFGHAEYVGRIREVDVFGACLGEIQEINPDGTYGAVHQFHGKSVYRLDKISLEEALLEVNPPNEAYCDKCHRYVEIEYGDPQYNAEKPLCATCREAVEQPAPTDVDALLEAGRTEAPSAGAVERTIAAIEQ